jgi:hypothetical protein
MGTTNSNLRYSGREKVFSEDPLTYLKYRKNVEANINQGFGAFYQNTPEALAAKKVRQQTRIVHVNRGFFSGLVEQIATALMREKLAGNERSAEALISKDFPVGCKRPT